MSFNQTLFNRAPFNLDSGANATWLIVDGYENVGAAVGVSTEIFLVCIPNEKVRISIHGERFIAFDAEGHEDLGWNVALDGTFWLDCQSYEYLFTESTVSSIASMKVSGEELLSSDVSPSVLACFKLDAFEYLLTDIVWYRIYRTTAELNELVSQVANAIAVEEIVCELNLTLQPGQRLIVDASNYNVLLDGENMIHTQQGDWLDELSRETNSITITAASGGAGLSANILYTERYL